MDAAMAVALGLVEAHAAGEDEVGAGEQRGLEIEQLARGPAEQRQLVHVVVDAQIAVQMARERHGHRGVVPEDARLRRLASEKILDEVALLENDVVRIEALRELRDRDRDSLRPDAQIEVRDDARLEPRLFDEQDAVVPRGAVQEVLRPLPDEIPAQMREADQKTGSSV